MSVDNCARSLPVPLFALVGRMAIPAAVLVLCTAACVPWEHGLPFANFLNDSTETVTVSIEGTDEVHVLAPNTGESGNESECTGTGIKVTAEDGTVIAEFDGETCSGTSVRIDSDLNVEFSDNLTRRSLEPTPEQ